MIYTVTLNPAVDVVLKLNNSCRVGKLNRADSEYITAGGKGINVSRVLKALKRDNIALGLIGGPVGVAIEEYLKKEGIKTDFARVNGNTRINVKAQYEGTSLEETQLNAPGPDITREDIMSLLDRIKDNSNLSKKITQFFFLFNTKRNIIQSLANG